MAVKIFLDTNVIIDFILKRPGELSEIEAIMNAGAAQEIKLYISESVITTSFYLLRKTKIDELEIF